MDSFIMLVWVTVNVTVKRSDSLCFVFAGLSDCDLLHKQVTRLRNGLLCHSLTMLSHHIHTQPVS